MRSFKALFIQSWQREKKSGNLAPIVFSLSLLLVFMVLAAQYESWTMPFVVLMAVPMGVLGAAYALHFCERALDVYAQIGLVMLIGLSAKNAILIVEFARERLLDGDSPAEAGINAAKIRLRPILMTALAFILGSIPLAIAFGAGANSRRSIGTTVVGGMTAATVLIILIPVFFILVESIREWTLGRNKEGDDANQADGNEVIEDHVDESRPANSEGADDSATGDDGNTQSGENE